MITTITTTAGEDARISSAFGKYLNLGRNATAAEVKASIVSFVVGVVQSQEFTTAQQAIVTTLIVPI